MLTDITSANAKLILTCEELYPSGVELQMFSTNQAWNADALQVAETRMGVDGHMAAGYVPNISFDYGYYSVNRRTDHLVGRRDAERRRHIDRRPHDGADRVDVPF